MDIWAKHIEPDENGVRIAELDEMSYRHRLWEHRPLTDFWRVGRGYTKKLEARNLFTMGDIARQSIRDEDVLYRLFGVNAELLIDHAWGWEPCTIADIKAYKPEASSIGSGQVLACPYTFKQARLVVREMADALALDLVDKHMVTDQVVLDVGYDNSNISTSELGNAYNGEVKSDRYGRKTPKPAHGSSRFIRPTSSSKQISNAVMELYDRITDSSLTIRRLNLAAGNVVDEAEVVTNETPEQLDMFTDYEALESRGGALGTGEERTTGDPRNQEEVWQNAILKGTSLMDGATAKERNRQIGGHKA